MGTSGVGMHIVQGEPAEGRPARAPVGAAAHLPIRPSTVLGGLALVALCLTVYLPGFFSIPPVDRDESRFAQASRQMFESVALPRGDQDRRPFTVEGGQAHAGFHSGGLAIPMLQDRPRLNKPPLIYWLQASSAAILTGGNPFRDRIWMYRVPSLLAAIGAVLFTWRLGARMFDARTGWLAAALLAVCPVVAWEAHQARSDMVLLAFTTLAMWSLWEVVRGTSTLRGGALGPEQDRRRGASAYPKTLLWALVFWLSLAGAILTKGPIAPMIAALTTLTFSLLTRRWRWLRSLHLELGIPIVALAIAPWVYSVASHVGFDTYRAIVTDEVLGRSISAKEGHWAPPGYHLVLLPVLFWPGSLMTASGLALAWRATRAARNSEPGRPGPGSSADDLPHIPAAYTFALAWIVPSWLIFELVSTKLPHYTLPLYPALAALSARAVFVAQAGLAHRVRTKLARVGDFIWQGIGWIGVACVVLVPALGFFASLRFDFEIGKILLALLALGGAAFAGFNLVWSGRALSQGRFLRAQLYGIVAAIVVVAEACAIYAPTLVPGGATTGLADSIKSQAQWTIRPIASAYHEDSLLFHLRGHVERLEEADASRWLSGHRDGIVVVSRSSPLATNEVDYELIGQLQRNFAAPTFYAVQLRPGHP